jgi:regulator of nonsense transcripts 3
MHVTKQEHVILLGDRVRDSTFHDTAKSWQDSALVGPPTVEFAPYPKMPGGRRRHDNRQGTIDQDPEFKDFLESLTNPITKPAAPEADGKPEKVKTTPLIEALREKKANKEKPNTKGGRNARGDAKDDAAEKKVLGKQAKENALGAGDKNRRISKADKAQAAKEAVKILNKEATSAKESAAAAEKNAAPERKRGNVAGVKSLLQRDLGLAAAPTRRRGTKREVATTAAETAAQSKDAAATLPKPKDVSSAAQSSVDKAAQAAKKERPTRAERRAFKASLTDKSNDKAPGVDVKTPTSSKGANVPAPQILKKPQPASSPAPPRGPSASRHPPTEPAAARQISSPAQANATPTKPIAPPAPAANLNQRAAPPAPVPAATSKQAFLKHANPSQGITEPLIEESLKLFGGIEKVEIDKRKGFAYVDFAEPEGLRKAMAASPIKIAQGAVQVLERKEKIARASLNPRFNNAPPPPAPTGPARGGRGAFGPRGRGGRGGSRGGHMVTSPAVGAVEPVASTLPAPPAAPTPVASVETAT